MRLKILHIINSLTVGGAEVLLVNSLSKGGLQEHVDNTLVYLQGTSNLEQRIDKGVKIICLNYKGLLSLPATLLKLNRIIRENRIDIVHSHLNPAGFYTHLACPSTVPHVHTIHSTYSMDKETSGVKVFLEKQLYLKNKRSNIILLSDFTKIDFLKAVPFTGKSFVLNNFVPDAFFDIPIAEEPVPYALNMIAIGTLKPLKNFEYLLDVFSYLKDYPVSLDIYGAGDKTAYERLINEKGLKVNMKGHCANIENVISNYNMFIMPSKFEGFPLSVFEAMAAGVPLMLSNIEPLRAIVKEHAIYFELNNAPKAAAQIIEILQNKTDINEIAIKAKAYAEKTVRRSIYINNLLDIYRQVLTK